MIQNKCQHPSCSTEATNTYRGRQDNALKLCDRHYYNLVSGKEGITVTHDTDPINPFWDSGFRCDSSDTNTFEVDPVQDTVSKYMRKAQRHASRKKGGPL